jgi:hypothetical protein
MLTIPHRGETPCVLEPGHLIVSDSILAVATFIVLIAFAASLRLDRSKSSSCVLNYPIDISANRKWVQGMSLPLSLLVYAATFAKSRYRPRVKC